MGGYTELPKGQLITVLKNILCSVPELIEEIAPDGFQNSIFHRYFMQIMKRRHRDFMLWRKEYSKHYTMKPGLRSFKRFCRFHNQKANTYDMEILMLVSTCLHDVFNHNSFVHNNKGGTYRRKYFNEFGKCLNKAILKTDILSKQITLETEDYFRYSPFPTHHKRNIPIYRFIFRKLKEKNIGFQYATIPKEYIDQMFNVLNDLFMEVSNVISITDNDHEKNVLAELNLKNEKEEEEYQNDLIEQLDYMSPPPIIDAYFDVYGDWPKGYPSED